VFLAIAAIATTEECVMRQEVRVFVTMFSTTGLLSSVRFGTQAENSRLVNIASQDQWITIAVGWVHAMAMGVLAIVSIPSIAHLLIVVRVGHRKNLFLALVTELALLVIEATVSIEDLATLQAMAVCVTILSTIGPVRDVRLLITVLNLLETSVALQTRAIIIVVGWELATPLVFIVFVRILITAFRLRDVLFITRLFPVTPPQLPPAVQLFSICLLTPTPNLRVVHLIRRRIPMLGLIGPQRLLFSLLLASFITFTNLIPAANPWLSPTS
jgi:hypothetical protein